MSTKIGMVKCKIERLGTYLEEREAFALHRSVTVGTWDWNYFMA